MTARRRAPPRYRARRASMRGPWMRPKKPGGIRRRPAGRMRRKPTAQKKRRTLRTPKIPRIPQGSPPSYFELLQEAVLTLKEAGKGASMPEIRRQLQKKYRGRFDEASNKLLTTALQRLAERGKVICKKGYKYKFNAPKVSKSALEEPSEASAASSSAYTGTSRSGATTGSAPSESDATTGKSIDSASSSYSGVKRSGVTPNEEDAKEKIPKDEAPANVEGEGKCSTSDLSSSASYASSTASRAPSKKR